MIKLVRFADAFERYVGTFFTFKALFIQKLSGIPEFIISGDTPAVLSQESHKFCYKTPKLYWTDT